MKIQVAVIEEAEEISNLIRSLSDPFFASPNREGAESFLESTSPEAIRKYISSHSFLYLVAKVEDHLVGVVALRENKHLYHLFVSPTFQGKGLGRSLWQEVKKAAVSLGNNGQFTVNSSLNAVPVYAAFGFELAGEVRTSNGVHFQPMILTVN